LALIEIVRKRTDFYHNTKTLNKKGEQASIRFLSEVASFCLLIPQNPGPPVPDMLPVSVELPVVVFPAPIVIFPPVIFPIVALSAICAIVIVNPKPAVVAAANAIVTIIPTKSSDLISVR
jgi:hypothetical protein